jgi:hypothetical protein
MISLFTNYVFAIFSSICSSNNIELLPLFVKTIRQVLAAFWSHSR